MVSLLPAFHTLHRRLGDALQRKTPPAVGAKAATLCIFLLLLLGPFVSHLHKAFHPERPHGDWYSIYSIAAYSYETGELEADENDPVVRTQRYPPITRPLLMLLALPPKAVSAVLSFALFAGLYVWSAVRVSGLFLRPTTHGRWAGALLALGLVFPYVWADLTAGNLTSVLLASATGAYVLASRGRTFRAGLVLSIGIMLKMIPALCLLYFLIRRKWGVAWGVLAGTLLFGVAPSLLIFGPQKLYDYHGYWYRTQYLGFTPLSTIDNPTEYSYQNQSLVRTMVRLFTPVNAGPSSRPFTITIAEAPRWALKLAYILLAGATGAALLWWLWRTRNIQSPETAAGGYALCVGSMLWFSPWVGSYYFSLALWPAVALIAHVLRQIDEPHRARWSHRALLLWFIAMPGLGSHLLRALSIHLWASVLLLLAGATTMIDTTRRAKD